MKRMAELPEDENSRDAMGVCRTDAHPAWHEESHRSPACRAYHGGGAPGWWRCDMAPGTHAAAFSPVVGGQAGPDPGGHFPM